MDAARVHSLQSFCRRQRRLVVRGYPLGDLFLWSPALPWLFECGSHWIGSESNSIGNSRILSAKGLFFNCWMLVWSPLQAAEIRRNFQSSPDLVSGQQSGPVERHADVSPFQHDWAWRTAAAAANDGSRVPCDLNFQSGY